MAAAIGNKYALGNRGGEKNLKFPSVKDLQEKIDAFFDSCYEVDEETGKRYQSEPFTITGLALALNTSREVLMNIQDGTSEGYSKEHRDAIIRAKLKCHNYAEKQLFQAKSPQGAIFALKNYGWKDNQSIEVTGSDGGPIQVQALSTLQIDDLLKLEEIMSKAQIQGDVMDITSNDE